MMSIESLTDETRVSNVVVANLVISYKIILSFLVENEKDHKKIVNTHAPNNV